MVLKPLSGNPASLRDNYENTMVQTVAFVPVDCIERYTWDHEEDNLVIIPAYQDNVQLYHVHATETPTHIKTVPETFKDLAPVPIPASALKVGDVFEYGGKQHTAYEVLNTRDDLIVVTGYDDMYCPRVEDWEEHAGCWDCAEKIDFGYANGGSVKLIAIGSRFIRKAGTHTTCYECRVERICDAGGQGLGGSCGYVFENGGACICRCNKETQEDVRANKVAELEKQIKDNERLGELIELLAACKGFKEHHELAKEYFALGGKGPLTFGSGTNDPELAMLFG